jgi:predicted DNA binding protein
MPSIDCSTLISEPKDSSVSMYEIALKFQHSCPYSDLSRRFPTARLSLWDNLHREFLDVRSGDRRDWPRLGRGLEALARDKGSRILRKTSDGKSYQFMIMTCACERKGTTLDWVMESECLFVPPIQIHGGWETYHAVGFDRGAAKRLLSKFRLKGRAEVAGQNRIDAQTLDQSSFMPLLDPLSGMTPMQVSALATSMSLGYYRLPRRTSTGKIAASLNVPRTTFQEHRKKAESKLMAALAPYVLTYVRHD